MKHTSLFAASLLAAVAISSVMPAHALPGCWKPKALGPVGIPGPNPKPPTIAKVPGVNPAPLGAATHGPTLRELLKMQWDFVVYTPDVARDDGTRVKTERESLPIAEALRRIAGTDKRPLLVLRECSVCNKTDDALLRPETDNEKTIVLSRWFHCVKLPVDVVEPDQPFNALFPTNDAEHLFVCNVDGSNRIPLESDTSRPELWAAMTKILAASYARDPGAATKEILHAQGRLDELDTHLGEVVKTRDDALENAGRLDKDKVQKLEKEIEATKKEIDSVLKSIDRLSKLELKAAKPT